MTNDAYELTFWGGTRRQYKRHHDTAESAETEARRVLGEMDPNEDPRAAHPAIIYGPGLGPDGKAIP